MHDESKQAIMKEYLEEDEELLWTGSPDRNIFVTGLIAKEAPLGLLMIVLTYFITSVLTKGVVRKDIVMTFMIITVGILYLLKVASSYARVRETEMKAVFAITTQRILSHCEGRDVREMPIDNHLNWQIKPSDIRFFHPTKIVNWSFWGLINPRDAAEVIQDALKHDGGSDNW